MKQTRIGIIREAIVAEGGNAPTECGHHYYCDGPRSGTTFYHSKAHRERDEVLYKVPNSFIGLDLEARKRVVDALLEHPEVKDAYLSRPYKINRGPLKGNPNKFHLKVVFQGTIN